MGKLEIGIEFDGLEKLVKFEDIGVVMEVGYSSGLRLLALAQDLPDGTIYAVTDEKVFIPRLVAEGGLEKKRAKGNRIEIKNKFGKGKIIFVGGGGEDMDYTFVEDGSVGLVEVHYVFTKPLEEFRGLAFKDEMVLRALDNLGRLLKPGGYLIISGRYLLENPDGTGEGTMELEKRGDVQGAKDMAKINVERAKQAIMIKEHLMDRGYLVDHLVGEIDCQSMECEKGEEMPKVSFKVKNVFSFWGFMRASTGTAVSIIAKKPENK